MSDRTPPITLAADRVQRTRPDSIARVDALDIGHDFIDDGWCPPDEAAALRARIAELEAQRDRVTDLFEKWAAEENEHRLAGEHGLAEGLHVAIEMLRQAVHGSTEPAAPEDGDRG